MLAIIGAPETSWVTVGQKSGATCSISQVSRVKPSSFMTSLNRNR